MLTFNDVFTLDFNSSILFWKKAAPVPPSLDSTHHFLMTEASGDCLDTGTSPTTAGTVTCTQYTPTGGPPPPVARCYSFPGTSGQYVQFGNVADTQFTSADNFSINFWMRSSFTNNQDVFIAHISGSYWGWQLIKIASFDGTQNSPFLQMQLGGAYIQCCGSTNLDDGNWHMVTYVHSGEPDGGVFYVDKVLETMHYASAGPVVPDYTGTALGIGHYGNADLSLYTGDISNIRIFVNKSLTQQEINGLYTNA